MPYEIIWEPIGVIKRHFGKVTGDELLDAVQKTEGSPNFDSYRYVINDFLDCTEISVSKRETEIIAAIDNAASQTNKRIRIAIVAINPNVIDLATHYANDPLTPYPTKLFSTMKEARAWIGKDAITR